MRSLCSSLVVLCIAAAVAADESPAPRKIDGAESVLAVYPEDWGLRAHARVPAVIFAAWPDGHVIWSKDRIKGGAPYYAGHIEPERFTSLLSDLEHDGLFADEKLNKARFGPDSLFTTLFVKSGKKHVRLQSWHEVAEARGQAIATSTGISPLDGQQRLAVLRKEPADYLYYRFVWSETRGRMLDLIPVNGKPTTGTIDETEGQLTWREAPTNSKPANENRSERK